MHRSRLSRAFAISILLTAASAAQADERAWSVGIGLGQAGVGTDEYGDGSAAATTLELGWRATDALSVVGGYVKHDNNGGFDNCVGPFCGPAPYAVIRGSENLFVGAEGRLPLGGDWSGLARLTYRAIDPQGDFGSDTSAITFGLGAEYALAPEWALRLTVETFDADSADFLETTLGLRYAFDGAALAERASSAAGDARWQLSVGLASNGFSGLGSGPFELEGRTTGYQLGGAARLVGPLWFELGYQDLGTFEGQTAYFDFSGGFPPVIYPATFTQDGTALSVGLRVEAAVGAGFSGLLRLGRTEASLDQRRTAAGPSPASAISREERGNLLGIGAAYALDARWSVELAYEDVDVSDVSSSPSFSGLPDSRWTLALRASF